VPVITRGDRAQGPLHQAGGKALFPEELESALREGAVDLAVHSAKDLPGELAEGTTIAAVAARADARDGLLSAEGWGPAQLPIGSAVGTSSLRRAALLLSVRPDVRIVPIRGNVDTRIRRVVGSHKEEPLDAALIAMAGVIRLGLAPSLEERLIPLDPAAFVPAPGQGALAVQALAERADLAEAMGALDNPPSRQALLAERKVVRAMSADCHSCMAVHIGCYSGHWRGYAMAARAGAVSRGALGTGDLVRVEAQREEQGDAAAADAVADMLISRLEGAGASGILH
jgi:hydroxymethylbilane synthase